MHSLKNLFSTTSVAFVAVFLSGQAVALEVGDPAPCVVLDGVKANGDAVRGCIRETTDVKHTHTIIEFFSVYCGTCKKNLPLMSQLSDDLKANATVRYVSIDPTADEVKTFLKSAEYSKYINFPTAFDVDRDAKDAYEVKKTPTLFILDTKYDIVYKHTGAMTQGDADHIKKLVLGH